MSAREEMPPARRRPIPGMASTTLPVVAGPQTPASSRAAKLTNGTGRRRSGGQRRLPTAIAEGKGEGEIMARRPAADYAATRLVNFRLPVDLHDRFKQLVREAERRHPRLRHPSLTELVIALLEEGPADVDEVVELIRRKRAAEHGAEP